MTAIPANLAQAAIGNRYTITKVVAPAGCSDWENQLQDIGFLLGEQVAVMARGMPGADPLVVRIGLSTFALRAAEAACIHVTAFIVPVP